MPAPFGISPSVLGRAFFHDCDRFLRYRATRNPEKNGVPLARPDGGPVMQAVLAGGLLWEEEVVGRLLFGRVRMAPGHGALADRTFTVQESLEALREARPGQHLYQLTLKAPSSLYQALGLDPSLVSISDNRPDLVAVEEGRRLRVIDIKRGEALRLPYRVQVLLYALELDHVLRAHGIGGAVDLSTGGAWLGGGDAPTWFEMETLRPHVDALLERLPALLRAPPQEADWHLRYRCEWCEYLDACRKDMVERDNISRLVGLTSHGKRFLRHQMGVQTLSELRDALTTPGFDVRTECCASLAGERPRLELRTRAFARASPQAMGTLHPALPAGENVAVFLTVQVEPVEARVWMVGYLVQAREELRREIFGMEGPGKPALSVAATREEAPGMGARFLERLYGLLEQVDGFNRNRTWKDQISLQFYCYADQEREALVSLLLQALDDPALSSRATALLFHFQGADLVQTRDHPRDVLPFPLIPLVSALGRLLALPVDVSYTLPEVLEALGSDYTYGRNSRFQFPFGHGLRADLVVEAWNGRSVDLAPLKREGASRLQGYRALLWRLRELAGGALFAWPPKVRLQESAGFSESALSRLAFLVRYESLLGCLAVRQGRLESRQMMEAAGTLVALTAERGDWFRVTTEGVTLEPSTYVRWLVVRDTDQGRLAQARFNDWGQRRAFRLGSGSGCPDVGVGVVDAVDQDALGLAVRAHVTWDRAHSPPLERGARVLLLPRFMDVNSDKLLTLYGTLDGRPGLFLDLLNGPQAASRPDRPLGGARLLPSLGLTPSQERAWQAVVKHRVVAVWGPPGTGKTHFLAAAILSLSQGQTRILVTAMTHAAIENLLSKVASLARSLGIQAPPVAKVAGWRSEMGAPAGLETPDKHGLEPWLQAHPRALVGSTVWGLERSCLPYDLVVVDEASQVKVTEAAVAVERVAPQGRLVLAGDHEQLGPIVAGVYPDPPQGEPALHGSVFDLARGSPGRPGVPVCQLLENFRMNDVLTAAARILYGPDFVCATPEGAARRTAAVPQDLSPLARACLDPAFPLVFVILEGVQAAQVNRVEADLVVEQVVGWRRAFPQEGDARFWRERAFVVSPHHAQIRAIRQALARAWPWDHPPFVDTVDKMQGQEADVVFISYGVSDPELAAMEAQFLYERNRLNVAITRARCRSVVFLPRPLLDACPQVLDDERAALGLSYMRGLVQGARRRGQTLRFDLGDGVEVQVVREGGPIA